ncbi:hypothetical protein DPEC_G00380580, partial [Dallia pectoralis]
MELRLSRDNNVIIQTKEHDLTIKQEHQERDKEEKMTHLPSEEPTRVNLTELSESVKDVEQKVLEGKDEGGQEEASQTQFNLIIKPSPTGSQGQTTDTEHLKLASNGNLHQDIENQPTTAATPDQPDTTPKDNSVSTASIPVNEFNNRKTVRKTRKFMVDGREVCVTTSKVLKETDVKEKHMLSARRQELQALKFLQREEQREYTQMEQRLQQQREIMFRHIAQEMTSKKQYYDTELERVEKQYVQQSSRMETEHTAKLREDARRIKNQQEREMTRKAVLLKAQPSEEQRFLQKQQQELNETLQKGVQEHKRKVASMEWDITVKTQQLKR